MKDLPFKPLNNVFINVKRKKKGKLENKHDGISLEIVIRFDYKEDI
jgi:hypothetical protein